MKSAEDKVLLAMVMLAENKPVDTDVFSADFEASYGTKIEVTGNQQSFAFEVDGLTVAIGYMDLPIPHDDIESTAEFTYNWPTVLEETKDHTSHHIVTIMSGGKTAIERYKIFTMVISSLLRTANSIGIYMGTQILLIGKDDYLNEAELLRENYLPTNLWVYIGLARTETGNAGYTYGLQEFNKPELEIIDSSNSLQDIRDFLSTVVVYLLESDASFKDGQTVGHSEDQKVSITYSIGVFVEGDTFKLGY